ncbi:MAG: putative type-1 restriction enzyme specificity protein MG438 [Deltaproteobacteria bacterium ADurb.Bin135]|jgi:type I restriction enzyme S subunit|nr:MAG: putative type-1 restriction enzyme specificity protein MG438 [Deltaproteobacteria bacterium ADurb.Bin135]HCI29905.1 hypothetical protein [Fervidobacterium sp.]
MTDRIPEGWRECKLGDVGKIITGTTPSKDNPEDWGSDTLFITPSDYKNYRKKAYSSIRKLSQIGAERQRNRLLPSSSVLVTCIGSDMGKSVVNAVPCVTNQQINAIIPNKSTVEEDYLYYLTVDLYETLHSLGGKGTAVPILNKTDFENINLLLPPLPEQHAIASVLGSLDDKIDLLDRENQTLEQMAEALFRQWFIEEADEQWEEVTLGDFFPVITGEKDANFATDDGSYPFFTCSKRTLWAPTYSFDGPAILLAGNGDFNIKHCVGKFEAYQRTYVLIPYDPVYFGFLLTLMKYYLSEITSGHQGSVIDFITKPMIKSFTFLLPKHRDSIQDNLVYLNELYKKIDINSSQILTLEKLRDTLLPKLMSGEVRVKL